MPKILIIDDDKLFLKSILIYLKYQQMQVIGAQSSQLGLQLARKQMPNLIICDIKLPSLDGYEVLKELHQEPITQKIPLIFLTALKDDSEHRRAMELGASDYLEKFCMLEELIQSIRTHIE